ncbi:MAG: hypothetical protein NVS3B16_14160 [Vulcanimicrobiaceae bacterium]
MRSPVVRIAVAAAAVVLLALIATTLVHGNVRNAVFGVAVALVPIAIWAALRLPMLFPFGLYVAFVPFDPLLQLTGGGGTLTKIAGAAAICAFAIRALIVRKTVVPQRSWFAWLAVILYASFSLVWSINFEQTRFLLVQMLSLFALFTVLAIYPIEFFELLWLRRTLIFTGIATAFYGIYASRTGHHPASPGHHHTLERLTISSGKLQFDPNHYAAFFMIPIAIVVVGFLCDRRPLQKCAYAATFVLLTTNVLLTGSRGGLIGVALIIFYLGWRTRKYVSMSAIVVSGMALSLFIPNVWARFADKTQGDGSGRNEIWSTGLHGVREYWLAGSGFGTYADVYDRYLLQTAQRAFVGWHRPSHSLIVESAVEFGILGSLLLGYAVWSSFRQTAAIRRTHPLHSFRLESEGMLVGILWMALTIDVLWYKYLWLALAFAVLVANVYRSRSLLGNTGMGATRRPPDGAPHAPVPPVRATAPL